jgi:hypothetical protein
VVTLLLLGATAHIVLTNTTDNSASVRLTKRNVRNDKNKEVSSAVHLYSGDVRLDFRKETQTILSRYVVVLPSPFKANGGTAIWATTASHNFIIY